jgi:very-short-patch-repair endonuclease
VVKEPVAPVKRARTLRRRMSQAELTLWTGLRRNNLGVHFRRQHPEPPYTLDFYCAAARLCVEVDGAQHEFEAARDARRDAVLAERGIAVWRAPATEVIHNADGVLLGVREAVARRLAELGGATRPRAPSVGLAGADLRFADISPAARERDEQQRP